MVFCLAVVGQIFIRCLPKTAVTAVMDDLIYEMNDCIYEVREKTATGARPLLFSKDSRFSFICLVLHTWASTIVGRAITCVQEGGKVYNLSTYVRPLLVSPAVVSSPLTAHTYCS